MTSEWEQITHLTSTSRMTNELVPSSMPPPSSQLRSITLLSPILSLLSLLTSPLSLSDRPDGANETLLDRPASQLHPQPLVDLAEVLRRASASKTEFALAFEHFMVAFGRICYADVPDLDSLFAGEDGIDLIALSSGGDVELGKRSGETEGEYWEGELERAGGKPPP